MPINASLIYYKSREFSKELDTKTVENILGIKSWDLNFLINGIEYIDYFKIDNTLSFQLKTTYPGLVIGIGYNHPVEEKGKDTSDFQLGFYFDHTIGMPVIPGSTVKGVLKSVFPKTETGRNDSEEIRKEKQKLNDEKLSYVNGLLEKLGNKVFLTQENWASLFAKGNIFFDAYVSDIPGNGKIFAEDYITPHTEGPFKDPIPIRFLKIGPGVTFTFQFKLVETKLEKNIVIDPSVKLELFKRILLDFGIGAKRNVGYGNLIEAT